MLASLEDELESSLTVSTAISYIHTIRHTRFKKYKFSFVYSKTCTQICIIYRAQKIGSLVVYSHSVIPSTKPVL